MSLNELNKNDYAIILKINNQRLKSMGIREGKKLEVLSIGVSTSLIKIDFCVFALNNNMIEIEKV